MPPFNSLERSRNRNPRSPYGGRGFFLRGHASFLVAEEPTEVNWKGGKSFIVSSASKKVLFIRFSSLGDIVLSLNALDAYQSALPELEAHWLVRDDFSKLLSDMPQISKTWSLKRNTHLESHLGSLWRLAGELSAEKFLQIIDLHRSLRSRVLITMIRLRSFGWGFKSRTIPSFYFISKERFRLMGLFMLKQNWPAAWRPTPWREKYLSVGHRAASQSPRSNRPVALPDSKTSILRWAENLKTSAPEIPFERFVCAMPSSLWPGKQWNTGEFAKLLAEIASPVVVLGTLKDQPSQELLVELKKLNVRTHSGIGWSLGAVAQTLKRSQGLVSVDTGLVHIAEALGIPVFVVHGPTHAAVGFAPFLQSSVIAGSDLSCRPCSKDGEACIYQGTDRYKCMKELKAAQVSESAMSWVEAR